MGNFTDYVTPRKALSLSSWLKRWENIIYDKSVVYNVYVENYYIFQISKYRKEIEIYALPQTTVQCINSKFRTSHTHIPLVLYSSHPLVVRCYYYVQYGGEKKACSRIRWLTQCPAWLLCQVFPIN